MSQAIMRLNLFGDTANGRPWQMQHGFDCDGLTSEEFQEVGELLVTGWLTEAKTEFLATLPASCTLRSVQAQAATPGTAWPYNSSILSEAGTRGSGDILPEGIAPLAMPRASQPSPSYRAYTRNYWPAILESDQEDGAIAATLVGAIINYFEAIFQFTIGDSANATLSILSAAGVVLTGCDAVAVSDKIARVRRRGRSMQGRS